ncbi:CGH_3_collapsed_G0000850.mRNA.1.CDS.1 [Saccharomyces cerevisiae]|nr:CGH_3_collapsed_G0000850.mRNA.1.CDS.1 [Saccharomyces cerevisiae]
MAKKLCRPRVPQPMKEKKKALKRFKEKGRKNCYKRRKSKEKRKVDENKHNNIDDEFARAKQLQEFMETMKPSSQVIIGKKVGIDKSIGTKN